MTIKVRDLFAGSGWGVACEALGWDEHGVEIMPEAQATRSAAGYKTVASDVRTVEPVLGEYEGEIASPSCKRYSPAGNGAGRRALDQVLAGVKHYADGRVLSWDEAVGLVGDEDAALTLEPLRVALGSMPRFIVWEQVPAVLPVWKACARVLADRGYSTAVDVLNAEQYGVPQTRRRAILVARRDDIPAAMPTPTHSRYHTRDADRLDSGVLPWVSMGETLGFYGFTAEKVMGKGMIERYGTRPGRRDTEPAFTIRASAGGMEPGGFVLQPSEPLGGRTDEEVAAWGRTDIPAPTVAGDRRLPRRAFRKGNERQMDGALRLTPAETAALQTYPAGFPFQGSATNKFLQIGNAVPPLLGQAILAPIAAAHALNIETEIAA